MDSVKMSSSDAKSRSNGNGGFVDVKKPSKHVQSHAELMEEHLPPLSLVFCVLIFSGSLLVMGLRDALATGKNIAGPLDEALLVSLSLHNHSIGFDCFQLLAHYFYA